MHAYRTSTTGATVTLAFVRTVRYRNFVVPTRGGLGFRFNEKCDLLPFLSEEFLGIVVHLAAAVPTFHVPLRKLPGLDAQLRDLLAEDLWRLRKVAQVLGLLLSMSCAVPTARLFSRDLNEAMYPNQDGVSASCRLPSPEYLRAPALPRADILPPCGGKHMVDSAGHRTTVQACMGCGP